MGTQSNVELVKLGMNMRGPPRKAKYYSTTDSESVRRLNGENDPYKGSEKVAETMCLHSGRSSSLLG